MITFRKRILAVNTLALIGTIFVASTLSASTLVSEEGKESVELVKTMSHSEQPEPAAKKGDLKIDLADVHKRPVRCVTKFRETTCTGWPLAHGMIALNEE